MNIKQMVSQTYIYRVYVYHNSLKTQIKEFCEKNYQDKTDEQKIKTERDMKHWYLTKSIFPAQYWEQKFDEIPLSEKKNMLPKSELVKFDKRYNPKSDIHIIGNKYECYERFKEYYGRECMLVKNPSEVGAFEDFCAKHKKVIIKPLFNDSGVGVEIFTYGESKVPSYPFIAEEIIRQSDALAKFHPQSVNTLRLNTIRCKDKVLVWQCILRYGRGNNHVDNAHFGGCFSAIDNNGYSIAAGDIKRHVFNVHPDSGVALTGFKVPDWEQACEIVKLLATKVGGLRFVGWDLAHTDNGWVVIEADTSPGILTPAVTGKGVAKEFYEIKSKM